MNVRKVKVSVPVCAAISSALLNAARNVGMMKDHSMNAKSMKPRMALTITKPHSKRIYCKAIVIMTTDCSSKVFPVICILYIH